MHSSIRSVCHETILLTTSSALSYIIYTCITILGGIVTDILGHLRHTASVAACSQLDTYVAHTYNYSQLYLCNLCTTFFHFRLVQEAEQKALISLLDMAWTTISYSQGIKIAVVASQIGSYVDNVQLQLFITVYKTDLK